MFTDKFFLDFWDLGVETCVGIKGLPIVTVVAVGSNDDNDKRKT